MIKRNKLLKYLFLFFATAFLFLTVNCFADNSLNWNDSGVYKPKPVLFLHGFAKGNPGDWNPAKTTLGKYFSRYSNIYSYLETISFDDPNGSVDTYDSGKLNSQGNSKGWSDKLNDRINELLTTTKYDRYTAKINLVCHSMGGLAARWYLANYSDNYIDKLILIGVPNLGTSWAMLANTASKVSKVGWMDVLSVSGYMSLLRDELDGVLLNLGPINIYGEAVDDMDSTGTGSGFLTKLNNVIQPQNVNYYGVIGTVGNPMNWVISGDYFGGDCVVKKNSQLGTGKVFYKQSSQIHSNHWREPEIAVKETDNKILQFLDSTPPEFTLDSSDADSTTEINTNSISIKGKVYKEYLPADSKLIITGIKQEDGSSLGEFISDLKPSNLWIPNNPDSPVAEFDETIALPGKGTYKISCQIKNPAGLTSDTKVFWVKVIIQSNANIIVHCHNPEGKEIASIQGVGQQSVEIYDGDSLIGYGAYDTNTHNKPISIPSGNHTIKAKFNGMTMSQDIDIVGGTTQELTFIFERVSVDVSSLLSGSFSISDSNATESTIYAYTGVWGTWSWSGLVYTVILKSDKGVSIRSYGKRDYGRYAGGDPPYPPIIVTASSNFNVDIIYSPTSFTVNGINEINIPVEYTHSPISHIQASGPVSIPGVITYFPKNPGFNLWFKEQNVSSYPDHSTIIEAVLYSASYGWGKEWQITPGFHGTDYYGYPIGYHIARIPTALPNDIELRLYKLNKQDYFLESASEGCSASFSAHIMGATTKISSVPYGPGDLS